jgi:hypothetical protein
VSTSDPLILLYFVLGVFLVIASILLLIHTIRVLNNLADLLQTAERAVYKQAGLTEPKWLQKLWRW